MDDDLQPRTEPTRIWRTLTPGIFTSGDRGRVLSQPGAKELVAHWSVQDLQRNPKQRFGPSLAAMSLVDYFTHAQQPVPGYGVDLIARLSGKQVRIHHETMEAWRLTGNDLNLAQIAERLGVSPKTVERRLSAHAALVESDVRTLAEDARNYGRIEHWPRRADKRRLYAVLREYTDRPLPLEAYQATAIALGLAHPDGRLTDVAVVALHGVNDPAAFHALARAEGKKRAQQPHGTVAMEQRQGPKRVRPLNLVSSVNGLSAVGVDRTTIEGWVVGPAVPSTDLAIDPEWTFEEWLADADARAEASRRFVADFKAASPWQREAWGHETVARFTGRGKRRQND